MADAALLRDTQQRQRQAEYITYDATITACMQDRQKRPAEAMLQKLQQLQMQVAVFIYHATMGACATGQQWMNRVRILAASSGGLIPLPVERSWILIHGLGLWSSNY